MNEYNFWILVATWMLVIATIIFGIITNRQTQKSNKLVQMEISNKLKPILEIRPIEFNLKAASQSISTTQFFQLLKTHKNGCIVQVPVKNLGLLTATNIVTFWHISNTKTPHDKSHKFKIVKPNIPSHAGFIFPIAPTIDFNIREKFYLSFCIEYSWDSGNNQISKNHKFYLYEITSNDIQLVTYQATND